jgi:hypothetical protein
MTALVMTALVVTGFCRSRLKALRKTENRRSPGVCQRHGKDGWGGCIDGCRGSGFYSRGCDDQIRRARTRRSCVRPARANPKRDPKKRDSLHVVVLFLATGKRPETRKAVAAGRLRRLSIMRFIARFTLFACVQ